MILSMRTLLILSLLCLIHGASNASETTVAGTDWHIDEITKERIRLISANKNERVALLVAMRGDGWQLAIAAPHFIYDTKFGSMGVLVKLNSHKPFSITNRSKGTILEVTEFDTNLFFGWSHDDDPVRWLVGRESIKIQIPEMGDDQKEYTINVKGLKTAMLEAQEQQRSL